MIRRYNSYKNAELVWLGSIPEGWQICRNKEIFYEVSNCKSTGEETLLTVSHITGVTPRSEKNVNMFFAESMEGYKKASKGDLIINTMWAWMGALGVSKEEGICSPSYNVYRNIRGVAYSPTYFDYLFRTPMFIMEMTRFSKGIVESRLRLYPKDFFRIQTCLPSLQEQTAIAEYLDTKTQAIDKKVSLLEKKIGYYQELRKSLINETVTKGLDKNVKLKASSIDWIGQIPEHWEVKRLKDIASITFSNVDKREKEDQESVLLCNYTDVYKNEFISSKIDFMVNTASISEIKRFELRKGDLICTKDSESFDDIANPAVCVEDLKGVVCGYHLALIRPNGRYIHSNYLLRLFQSEDFNYGFKIAAKGITRVGLGINVFFDAKSIIPTLSEQIQIADYLTDKTSKIDKIITNIQTQITTLKELRKTLINDVVTGKIKVIQD